MKPGRQRAILEIIADRDIETQHQLLLALAERGVTSTQATLSRDIKDMRLIKELGPNGNYRYVAAKAETAVTTRVRDRSRAKSFFMAKCLLVIFGTQSASKQTHCSGAERRFTERLEPHLTVL